MIWVAPRLCADVQELTQVNSSHALCVELTSHIAVQPTQIAHQLENKFGKPFAQQARSNLSGTVNPKVCAALTVAVVNYHLLVACYLQVIHRLGAEAPKKSLVENYMIEIARNYKVEYEPDPTMFMVSLMNLGHCIV